MLYDNELISFIEARDKWLAPNGILLPDRWTLRVAAIGDKSGRYSNNFWNNVYECNMKPLLEVVETKPVVIGVHAKKVNNHKKNKQTKCVKLKVSKLHFYFYLCFFFFLLCIYS